MLSPYPPPAPLVGRQFWPFHGGNTSSNLVGEANSSKDLRETQRAGGPTSVFIGQRWPEAPLASVHPRTEAYTAVRSKQYVH